MAANYVLLEKITVGAAGASSVTFSGIPQTGYTDLVVKGSVRSALGGDNEELAFQFNNDTTANKSYLRLLGFGTGRNSANGSSVDIMTAGLINASTTTASTFASFEIYIPNYTSSTAKSSSVDTVSETNGAVAYASLTADLWTGTAAITSIKIFGANLANLVQYSTFYLYGVAKLNTTPAIAPYATGGSTIMTDGTYWYHAFLASGTFTPQKALSCDYLVVAGGGGGGSWFGGGGGAGGYRTSIGGSPLSLTTTNYTVTVGAGGAGGVIGGVVGAASGGPGVSGTTSTFSSISATGGGFGNGGNGVGANGGSGGGASANNTIATGNAGGYTPSEGTNGGNGSGGTGQTSGGGGGGSSAAGGNGVTNGGAGGNGTSNSITGIAVTYAGGGGGGGDARGSGVGGTGGTGGGGSGSAGTGTGTNGTANLGGGGGGSGVATGSGNPGNGGAGGSGLVIVRYSV